jgi:predicted dienelactone hydrolase
MLLRAFDRSIWMPALLAAASSTLAAQVGWTQLELPGPTPRSAGTVVVLFYPTQAKAREIPMGPFTPHAASQAAPEPGIRGLILVSHGLRGSELGHSRLAEALAANGYLVAALRHPGDNWQDSTLISQTPELYFQERPRQVSRVIDALLADPVWKDRIPRDAKGPKIAAFGHSAGGYTVVALAGGVPDAARLAQHCQGEEAKEDPIFCSTSKRERSSPPQDPGPLKDPRVRAVAALAPVGVLFSAASLAKVDIPMVVYAAEKDRWLVPRFHAQWIVSNVPGAVYRPVPNAWHFAFMDTPSMAIPTPDGDIRDNPPGFDRAAFLRTLGAELTVFFDRTLH